MCNGGYAITVQTTESVLVQELKCGSCITWREDEGEWMEGRGEWEKPIKVMFYRMVIVEWRSI